MIRTQLSSTFGATVSYLKGLIRSLATWLLSFVLELPLIQVRDQTQPPGPICNRLPIFGSLPLFAFEASHLVMARMAESYGKIFRLQFGNTNFIVICDHELLQQTFSKTIAIGRHIPTMMDVMNHQGIIHADGDFWKVQRAFVTSNMRRMGMPPTSTNDSFERKANYAIEGFLQELSETQRRPTSIEEALCFTLTNIYFSLIVGTNFDRHDSRLLAIIDGNHDSFRSLDLISFPNYIPQFAGLPKQRQLLKTMDDRRMEFERYMREIVEKHRNEASTDTPDLIDAFLARMKLDEFNDSTTFTEKQLYYVLGDLFSSAMETTSTTIRWLLLALLHNPYIQDTIHRELDHVMGMRQPELRDRRHLPYINAVILEGLRFPSILPFGVFHSTMSHSTIDGFDIPVKSTVVGLFWKIHRDPKLWASPNTFDPSNHLNASGNLNKARYLMPFSYGRRVCLGDDVAQNEIFLIFSNLLHKFRILPEEGVALPSMDECLHGLLRAPLPFRIRFVLRSI